MLLVLIVRPYSDGLTMLDYFILVGAHLKSKQLHASDTTAFGEEFTDLNQPSLNKHCDLQYYPPMGGLKHSSSYLFQHTF